MGNKLIRRGKLHGRYQPVKDKWYSGRNERTHIMQYQLWGKSAPF